MPKHLKWLFAVSACILFAISCKKDNKNQSISTTQVSLQSSLTSFAIAGQLYTTNLNEASKSITIVIPQSTNLQSLTATFTLSEKATASINNTVISSGQNLLDFTNPVNLKITSGDGKSTSVYNITVQNEIDFYGLGKTITNQKSLDKEYNFYLDQFDGSTYQGINCGPTVTAMAIHWANPNSTITPIQARNTIRPTGGWWFTSDIESYLSSNGVDHSIVTANDLKTVVKTIIDNGKLLILCLDMYPVKLNGIDYQHTDKFYATTTTDWGHFLLVKGYKVVDNKFYLEVYDPYSNAKTYSLTNQIKGKNRYYLSDNIQPGVNVWWPYAIVVAGKNQTTATASIKPFKPTRMVPVASGM